MSGDMADFIVGDIVDFDGETEGDEEMLCYPGIFYPFTNDHFTRKDPTAAATDKAQAEFRKRRLRETDNE